MKLPFTGDKTLCFWFDNILSYGDGYVAHADSGGPVYQEDEEYYQPYYLVRKTLLNGMGNYL